MSPGLHFSRVCRHKYQGCISLKTPEQARKKTLEHARIARPIVTFAGLSRHQRATPHSRKPGPHWLPHTAPRFQEPPSPPSQAPRMPRQVQGAPPTHLQALLTPRQPSAVPHTVLVTRWSMQGQDRDWGLAHLLRCFFSSDISHNQGTTC